MEYHAHDLLQMDCLQSGVTLDELKNEIQQKFGDNPQFCTCSMEGMNTEAILAFVMERQKIVADEQGKYFLNRPKTCF